MPFYVYILRSESTGQTYVGQTADLDRRVAQHNDPECTLTKHTKKVPGPWRVIHSETYTTRADAMRREKELKSGKGAYSGETDRFVRRKVIVCSEGK